MEIKEINVGEKGKVERVKYPETPNKPYGVCINGNWYNTFDKEIGGSVKSGYLVEFKYETNEKGFNNLTNLRVIEAGAGTPIPKTAEVGKPTQWAKKPFTGDKIMKRDPAEERRITRMACLNSSIAFLTNVLGEQTSEKEVLRTAEKFFKWVREENDNDDIGVFM